MKKTVLLAIMVVTTLISPSQILNSSFEHLNANGTIKNWGFPFITTVTLDSNGVSTTDSVVFDNQLYFSSSDAHTGSKALEMRNAYYFATNKKIAGSAKLTPNDSDYAAFEPLIVIPQRPDYFSFYFKFFPAGADTAVAQMVVFDSTGVAIGSAEKEISGTYPAYSLASQPVIYPGPEPGAFVAIRFCTSKTTDLAGFGTRFLVDDVNLLATSTPKQFIKNESALCFPNPVVDCLNLRISDKLLTEKGSIQIIGSQGNVLQTTIFEAGEKLIRLNTSQLAQGSYVVRLQSGKKEYSLNFIK